MKSRSHPIQYGDGMLINSESAVTPNFNKAILIHTAIKPSGVGSNTAISK